MLNLFSKYYRSMTMEYMSLSYRVEKYQKWTKICQVKWKPKISVPRLTNSFRKTGSCLGSSLLGLKYSMLSNMSVLV